MFLVKHFRYGLVVKVDLWGNIRECSIGNIECYESYEGRWCEFFKLGYIMGVKSNLSGGWLTNKEIKVQAEAARMLSEAFDIFEDDFTKEELLKLGYKETNTLTVRGKYEY